MRCKALDNKKMNDQVFAMRRQVIELIYALKTRLLMPRITVRITDNHETYLAVGTMNESVCIWITEDATKLSKAELLHVVAHEIGHAVFKLPHDDKCPLMAPVLHKPADFETIIKCLTKRSA